MTDLPLLAIALGGNALSPPAGDQTFAAERRAIARTAEALAVLAARGHRLLVVHGNGPQVGRLLRHDPDGRDLDVRVAQTQGELGYLLADALERTSGSPCAALLTRVTVDPADPAFDSPSKPVGPLLDAPAQDGPSVAVHGGFRRVVASPRPVGVVELRAIETLLATHHVIAGGGGGVPVAPGCGAISGVIDKDYVAAMLAITLDAHLLVFATDVEGLVEDFGTANGRLRREIDTHTARSLLAAGRLAPGSMAPKLESATRFVEATGSESLIAHTDLLACVLERPHPGTLVARTRSAPPGSKDSGPS